MKSQDCKVLERKSAELELKESEVSEDSVSDAIADLQHTVTERMDALGTELSQVKKRADELETKLARPAAGTQSKDEAAELERKAVGTFARTGNDTELKAAAMSVGSDPDGGYLVMPAVSAGMTKKLFDSTPMRRLSRVETITAGDAWVEPVDFGDVGAVWAGEKQSRPATDTPDLDMLRIPVEEIYALQPVTQRLLDDTGFDLGGWLEGKISDRFARSEGSAFVSGTGVKMPSGFLTYSIVATSDATRKWGKLQYVPSGEASIVTADGLRDLTWSLRAPYRAGAVFLMNSNTAAAIDKLKNENNDYIWRSAMTAGAPNSLLGYPVEFDENMPDIEAGTTPIAFGNFKLGYVVVDKVGIRFLRDPFTDKPNVQFYAYRRVGGGVANSEAIKLLKIAES